MTKITLTQKQVRELANEEAIDDFEEVDSTDWKVDYKWQHCKVIVRKLSTGKLFSYPVSRSGSHFSGYYYSYEDGGVELTEVQKVKKVIEVEEWEAV